MNTKRVVILLAGSLVLIGLILAFSSSFNRPALSPLPITIARLKSPHSGLIHIAEAKGFFLEEGLAATIKTTQTGYEAITQALQGEIDVATAAETPIARTLAEGKQIKVLATIFSSQWNSALVVRIDRGITKPADLKGKRIGYVFGTATHYELETFLAFHNIALDSITLVRGKPDEVVAAIVAGEVDAASIWTPFLTQIQQKLGEKAETYSPKEFYSEMTNIVVRADYPERNREETNRLLRALLKAENFAKKNPDEAINIIASVSEVDPNVLKGHGDPLTHELLLKHSLLLATENQIRWFFQRGLVSNGPFPDVLQAFETEPLRAIKPTGVTIAK